MALMKLIHKMEILIVFVIQNIQGQNGKREKAKVHKSNVYICELTVRQLFMVFMHNVVLKSY